MLSENLVNHYFTMQRMSVSDKSQLGRVVSDTEYMSMLNKSGIDWTYEITGEYFIDDLYNVTVAVFIPGEMRMGLGTTDKEFGREYRVKAVAKAIGMACKQLRVGTMVAANNNNSIPNSVDSDKDKDKGNTTVEQPNNSGSNSQGNNQGDKPQGQSNGKPKFTQIQINKMEKFKTEYNIENDEQLLNYIKTWDKSIVAKNQLTPTNIDSFLEWIDKMNDNGI